MRRRFVKKPYIFVALILTGCLEAQPPITTSETPSSSFNVEVVSDTLAKPWGVTTLPNGDYFVTEIGGTAKRISKGQQSDIIGLPDDILVYGQGGLLGVTLAPDFNNNPYIFLAYSYGTKKENGTAVFKARLDNHTLRDGEVIYRSTAKSAGSHYGGRLAFLPDGSLIVTLGDGFAFREQAQNLGNSLGKIVRLMPDGSPGKDNPFLSTKDAATEIYSYGHRNVQGLSYDAQTDKLWAHEHGPRGGDELNLIRKGLNYGWPLATTGVDYNGARISPHKTVEGTEPFVYDWVPSIAPSGLTIYRGALFPEWHGDALIGSLVERTVWRIDLDGTKAVGAERLLIDLNQRVRDVQTDRDGALLVLTETSSGGQLTRVTPK